MHLHLFVEMWLESSLVEKKALKNKNKGYILVIVDGRMLANKPVLGCTLREQLYLFLQVLLRRGCVSSSL